MLTLLAEIADLQGRDAAREDSRPAAFGIAHQIDGEGAIPFRRHQGQHLIEQHTPERRDRHEDDDALPRAAVLHMDKAL